MFFYLVMMKEHMLSGNEECDQFDTLSIFVQKRAELRKAAHSVERALLQLVKLIGNVFVDGSFGREVEFGEHFGEFVLRVNVRF